LLKAVEKQFREELVHGWSRSTRRKIRMADLANGEKSRSWGSNSRRTLSHNGVWTQYTPRLKKRTALLTKLGEIVRRFTSKPVERA
jgi:RNA-directed DNA polymerase